MPTVVSHAIVAAGLFRLVAGPRTPGDGSRLAMGVAAALAMLPDADVVGWNAVSHDTLLWHRGLTHSLAWALATGALAAWLLRRRVTHHGGAGWLAINLAACIATHGLLDAFTDGGSGVGFLMPFDAVRTHFASQPIPVAPITVDPTNHRALQCIATEALLLWPLAIAMGTAHRKMPWGLRAVVLGAVGVSAWQWVARS